MIGIIKKMLGIGPEVNYAELVKKGALVLDVRSVSEYASGHIKGSRNISVDQLSAQLKKLPSKETPIITCCASGMRSAAAKSLLKASGYKEVYNGGAWHALQAKLR